MPDIKEWVTDEVADWLLNYEYLEDRAVKKAKFYPTRYQLASALKLWVTGMYEDGVRFGDVTKSDLRHARWQVIADNFRDDAPWGKGETTNG